MIEQEKLTRNKVKELLHTQRTLQAEAYVVLAELHLLERLATIGSVRQVGSSLHGLMVWRDIDLSVSVAETHLDHILEVIHPLYLHAGVKQIHYLKEAGIFHSNNDSIENRHYFKIFYFPFEKHVEWKIDISFWLCEEHPEPIDDMLTEHLTPKKRLAILWLKEIWHCLPTYHHQVHSIDIYDAVLHHNVQTPGEFDSYLMTRGKPNRTRQA